MEHEFHQWLKSLELVQRDNKLVQLGIGDDAAILAPTSQATVIATDTIAAGTHFDLNQHSLELIGRKALAVNLSDLAAMAAQPVAAVLTFMLPRGSAHSGHQPFGLQEAKRLFTGIQQLANEFDVAIIGGDTNTWEGPLVVGATVIGHRDPQQSGWQIDGAQPGDGIVVSGSFGGSIHGRHLSFTPRIELANYLVQHYHINGATDASDSLSLDMSAMARVSGVGIDFITESIPISTDVRETDPELALSHALSDGEDFELILAVRQSEIGRLMADPNLPCKLTVLGAATDLHHELQTQDTEGNSVTYVPRGYVH